VSEPREELARAPRRRDMGTWCVICERPTHFGSGRFVNRIPAEIEVYDELRTGYMCAECQED